MSTQYFYFSDKIDFKKLSAAPSDVAQQLKDGPGDAVGDEGVLPVFVLEQTKEPVSDAADGHACGVAVGKGGGAWVARPHDDTAFTGGFTPRLRPGGSK